MSAVFDVISPRIRPRPKPRLLNGVIPFVVLLAGLAIAPLMLTPYSTVMLMPALAFGIALLGMNLLFGYTGLLSFGHAMFLAVGAYVAAAATQAGVLHFELILIAAASLGGLFALAIGALCVRFTHIFFGMLTLAFGMLLHSFLFKFYNLTGVIKVCVSCGRCYWGRIGI